MQTLTDEQEICKSSAGLFSILNVKFKSKHNKTVLLLPYCKQSREENKSPEKWMGCLRVKTIEYSYKEYDR